MNTAEMHFIYNKLRSEHNMCRILEITRIDVGYSKLSINQSFITAQYVLIWSFLSIRPTRLRGRGKNLSKKKSQTCKGPLDLLNYKTDLYL